MFSFWTIYSRWPWRWAPQSTRPATGLLPALVFLRSAHSLTLSYSSLALLSISRMSMGLWSLQPLAWLGLCLSRAACWDRRVSSSTTLEEENQVLERPFLTQYDPRFWRPFSKDTGRLPHGNNAFLTLQNTEPQLPHPSKTWMTTFTISLTTVSTNIVHC